jgi:hypothetical protein
MQTRVGTNASRALPVLAVTAILTSVGFSNAQPIDAEGQASGGSGLCISGAVGACWPSDQAREPKHSVTMQLTVGDDVVTNMVSARQVNSEALAA